MTPSNDCIVFSTDAATTQAEIARCSTRDAENHTRFFEDISRTIAALRLLLPETPVDPGERSAAALLDVAGMGWRYRGLGEEFCRIVDAMTQSAFDFTSRWFESEEVKALFCHWAGIGNFRGPRSPGTACSVLFHLLGENGLGFAKGGMGGTSNAIAAAGQVHGMEIETGAEVERIEVRAGRATGEATQDGRDFGSRPVASNLAAPATFGALVPRDELPNDFMEAIDRYRCQGQCYKVNCAVDRLPTHRGFSPGQANVEYPACTHIGPTIDYMERAHDDAKCGWCSKRPFVSAIVPSFIDDSLAPAGKHVVTLSGGHAPYQLKNGDRASERDNFVGNVLSVTEEFSSGFRDSLIAYEAFLPQDLEEILGMPGGHELHGEIAPDQLFFQRPVPHYANCRSPIRALHQCGSSTHPGGSVSEIPGHNAAREILKDQRFLN